MAYPQLKRAGDVRMISLHRDGDFRRCCLAGLYLHCSFCPTVVWLSPAARPYLSSSFGILLPIETIVVPVQLENCHFPSAYTVEEFRLTIAFRRRFNILLTRSVLEISRVIIAAILAGWCFRWFDDGDLRTA